jgi:5-hydroxyisourate hydrolase
MKGLTTHVLDTLRGVPAVNVEISLYRLTLPNQSGWSAHAELISTAKTNEEGRCLMAPELAVGEYELRFNLANYFSLAAAAPAAQSMSYKSEHSFLGWVHVRFFVADADQHYHIPLVASPWSYATYKGGAPKTGAK